MRNTEKAEYSFPLDSESVTIGRHPENDIVLHTVGVSKYHAEIRFLPEGPFISDSGSTFGIRINQVPVSNGFLKNGYVMTIGIEEIYVSIQNNLLILRKKKDRTLTESIPEIKDSNTIHIGRDASNDIQLKHPMISRFHSTVSKTDAGRYSIADHGSTNGTYVNGRNIHHALLEDGDIIQIGPYRFMLEGAKVIQADYSRKIKLDAHGISVWRNRKAVLDRISLSILPGEFIAILGPSGSGKTTLAKVLTGQLPPDSGSVYYNGFPLSRFAAAFSSVAGYVSQENLLRPELTVWETFSEQVIIRLPKDSLEVERVARIKEVMDTLDISSLSSSRICNLSGGEAKRVHLGIELLSAPTIIFLDEPFSGLDPGLVQKFMKLFKDLCNKGYTLILTTHTLEQIDLCNRLFFLSKGKLIYQGTPEETTKAMSITTIAEAYEKLRSGEEIFCDSEYGASHVDEGYKRITNLQTSKSQQHRYARSAGFFKQFFMLTTRYTKILFRDVANLVLILLQAPLIGLLLALVFHGDSQFLPISFYFCVTISAIWIGGVNSVREIAREWELYEREFRVGLSSSAYVAAKCTVTGALAFFQAVLFTLSLHFLFEKFSFNYETLLITAASTVSGAVLGLCISAFSGNVNRALSLLPIIFIPQIFFSGILIPFDMMPDFGRIISNVTISRPAFSMFKKVCLLEQQVFKLAEWRILLLINLFLIILIGIQIRWHCFFAGSKK